MKPQISRRDFLKGAGSTAIATMASLGVVGQILNSPIFAQSNATTTTNRSELEQWLLSTGKEELSAELYEALKGTSSIYLPLIVK